MDVSLIDQFDGFNGKVIRNESLNLKHVIQHVNCKCQRWWKNLIVLSCNKQRELIQSELYGR